MSQISAVHGRVPTGSERARLREGVHIELSPRRVRAFFANEPLADSQKVLLVFETRRPPVYWFPTADVRMDLLARTEQASGAGPDTVRWRSTAAGRSVGNLAWRYAAPS